MPSLLLILPSDTTYCYRGAFKKSYSYAPLTLTTLAALLPDSDNFRVDIIDEGVERPAEPDRHYDLVGITCVTSSSPRAYELCSFWRARGAYVVLGGAHPTLLPNEALQHADTVIAGAAETSWPAFITDFLKGTPQKFYADSGKQDSALALPVPCRDLIRRGLYLDIPTVIARPGCRNHCAFCSIPFMGAGGAREIKNVIDEITVTGSRKILFLDPNITVDRQYAKELFAALISLRIQWAGLASIDAAQDSELVGLMAESGCIGLLVGFESLHQKNLVSAHKYFARVTQYSGAIRTLHDAGIAILGCFVLGFDNDTRESLRELPDLVGELRIDLPRYSILTPFPGTDLFSALDREKRILTKDWSMYDTEHVVFKPACMEPEELQQALYDSWRRSYRLNEIVRRFQQLQSNRLFGLLANLGLRHYGKRLYKLRRVNHASVDSN
jgi:radical SAM superfamily enzyme YgiQ (UPF0313 family)